MTGFCKFQIDAWFSTVSSKFNNETGESEKRYGLMYPNTWGSVNKTKFLNEPEDMDKLLLELEPVNFQKQLIKNSLDRHSPFIESGVNFNRILAYQVIIDVVPPHFNFTK